MIIGTPKVRKKMNAVIDSFCGALFFVLIPFAIMCCVVTVSLKKIF